MSALTTSTAGAQIVTEEGRRQKRKRALLSVFLAVVALIWLAPLLWAAYTSLRPFFETAEKGYLSLPDTLSFENFSTAWTQADIPRYYLNTFIITVPSVILVLLLSSMIAFGVSRFSFRFNVLLLMIVVAGNLLPQQVIITPLFRLFLLIPLPEFLSDSELLYDSFWGIGLVHVAFQMGFCTFVLSNYMKTLSPELNEAAAIDGASAWTQYWRIILPLTRPPMAALATLQFTWIYNDFFWALVLVPSSDKRPITSGLANLEGQFFTNNNLIAAGSLLAAIPTILVFIVLQKQFVAGLTLGSSKG